MDTNPDRLLCKCLHGKCEQTTQELSIKCVSKPAIYYKSRIFHSSTAIEKASQCKEKTKSPRNLSTYAKMFAEWVQRFRVPAFGKYIYGYFLNCSSKLTVLANDINENAVSILAVIIQMTSETVQRAAGQSVQLSLATAVLASGESTISLKASGFSEARAAWTCNHCWPNNSSKACCSCTSYRTHN